MLPGCIKALGLSVYSIKIEEIELFPCDTGICYTERLRALTHARKNFTINSSSEEIENKQTFEQSDLTLCNAIMVGKILTIALSA